MRRIVVLVGALGLVLAALPVAGHAGAPKNQHLASLRVDRHDRIVATVAIDRDSVRLPLAQVTAPVQIKVGARCRRASTAIYAMAVASDLHLDLSVRLAPEGRTTYLVQPQDSGEHETPTTSLNM